MAVNKEYALELADRIERSDRFNMNHWFHGCGTAACIAGHIVGRRNLVKNDVITDGANALGISIDKAVVLFQPWGREAKGGVPREEEFTQEGALSASWGAAVLRKLAHTGEVDWMGTRHCSKEAKAAAGESDE